MLFFFFKQKTAYEMRISDWSSDVCSSDLQVALDKYSFIRDAYLQRRSALVRRYKAQTGSGSSLPDYSEPSLPDYSDPDLPDYSGVEPVSLSQTPEATPSAPASSGPASTASGASTPSASTPSAKP